MPFLRLTRDRRGFDAVGDAAAALQVAHGRQSLPGLASHRVDVAAIPVDVRQRQQRVADRLAVLESKGTA